MAGQVLINGWRGTGECDRRALHCLPHYLQLVIHHGFNDNQSRPGVRFVCRARSRRPRVAVVCLQCTSSLMVWRRADDCGMRGFSATQLSCCWLKDRWRLSVSLDEVCCWSTVVRAGPKS